jgi:L-asparaginase
MQGRVEMGRYDTGFQLKEAGVVSGYDSTVESAVTKLMFLQSHNNDPEQVRTLMNTSIRGEITL